MTVFSLLLPSIHWQFGSLPTGESLTTVECLVLASVFCATDTVAALLFGEGVVNDAVSILIFETVVNVFGKAKKGQSETISGGELGMAILHFVYLSIASIGIGILFGMLSAFITRWVLSLKDHPIREILLIFLLAYLSYMISEELGFSGIIGIFCCGFTMNHYTYYNLSEDSKLGSVLAIQTMSHFCEAATYAFLGFSVFSIHSENASLVFMLKIVGITMLARVVSVALPMAGLRLLGRRLDWRQQVYVSYAGLIRGAIAYALTYRIDTRLLRREFDLQVMRENTFLAVVFSTVVFGSLMTLFAKVLGIKVENQAHDA